VLLKWTTINELNNSGFEIQRRNSSINNNWINIGFVNGLGNSSSNTKYTFKDEGLNTGKYYYRLKQIDFNGNYKYYELSNNVEIGVPERSTLFQNYPNPFNPQTKINFNISYDGFVSLLIYDVNGREVSTIINDFKKAGYYSEEFDGSNLSSGIYFYKLISDRYIDTKSMILLK